MQWVENPGRSVAQVFAKIHRLSGKIAWGVPLFWVLLHFHAQNI
jgi:hypothetical protein